MLNYIASYCRQRTGMVLGALAFALATPVMAQDVQRIDPNAAIDGDLAPVSAPAVAAQPSYQDRTLDLPPEEAPVSAPVAAAAPIEAPAAAPASAPSQQNYGAPAPGAAGATYKEDDLIGAAEGVFGKGAEGLARMIEDVLKKQGEPNGYIVGREGGGAFVFGVRYGSGTLYHKIEGQMPVYWTGPSIGLDAGANASNTFVLVYNLHDTEDLYERFPAGEGQAYFVGGFNASYMRRGDVVLIPIRVGAGLRLGVNAGYMKFSKRQRWLPF